MRAHLTLVCLATVALAACSGGGSGGGLPTASGGSGTTTPQSSAQSTNEQAVAVTNGVGTPVKNFASYEQTISTATSSGVASNVRFAAQMRSAATASGTCKNGVEFFSPDSAGDPNSTETKLFYDVACTDLASDAVRLFTSTGSSAETVARTEMLYAPNNATAIATRTSTAAIANATFDTYGFAIAADGFSRSATSQLSIGSAKTIAWGDEIVMTPASSGTNEFCEDSAGYSVTGSATLGETFGWAGGVLGGGSRTVNSDGSVTWTATHSGAGYKAPIGGLAIATGALNSACPIATPAYTLTGGTSVGTYSIPLVATYRAGMLVSLSVTGATLTNGNTLSISTTPGALPSSSNFITGTISQTTTQIASFSVNAFGDGILTVTKTGAQFVITDWHVVK
jgi:hypothetical protein